MALVVGAVRASLGKYLLFIRIQIGNVIVINVIYNASEWF